MDFIKTQSLPLRRQAKTIKKVVSATHFITLIRATITSYSKNKPKPVSALAIIKRERKKELFCCPFYCSNQY